jgi:uncharacterized membrane protein YgaE (UPF0421/DUF939 family)
MVEDNSQRPIGGRTIVSTRQSLHETVIYAAQMVFCSAVLLAGYRLAHAAAVQWAIITVAVILQPGLQATLTASTSRIAANLIGAAVGLGTGLILGDSYWQFILALLITIFLCHGIRLDQSMRSACVAVAIVMLSSEGHLVSSGLERTTAVIIGCAAALAVGLGTRFIWRPFPLRGRLKEL